MEDIVKLQTENLKLREELLTYQSQLSTLSSSYSNLFSTYQTSIANLSASLVQVSQEKEIALKKQESKIAELQVSIKWFISQIFGAKSEKRVNSIVSSHQIPLLPLETPIEPPPVTVTVKAYEKQQRKKPNVLLAGSDSRLKFSADVPVETVELPHPDTVGLSPDEYKIISYKESYKLAAYPKSHYVIKYVQPVVKIKDKLISPPSIGPIKGSYATTSFLSKLLVDKFQYHLPLYRQHQKLEQDGIFVHRGSLTKLLVRTAELLEPIHKALLSSVLTSDIITIDETPLKVGKKNNKMHTGYLVPIYSSLNEVAFQYSPTRSLNILDTILADFQGTALTDGYQYYVKLNKTINFIHALCWNHSRREFFKAKELNPELVGEILDYIGKLYQIEAQIREEAKEDRDITDIRLKYSLPIVDYLFKLYQQQYSSLGLPPSHPLMKAFAYAISREKGLRVFLANPQVPIDTNHLEREIRPTAVGRKNWLFCQNDVGAQVVCIASSLVRSCILQDINPYDYFCDILDRIDHHPMRNISDLLPRNWKNLFAPQSLDSS